MNINTKVCAKCHFEKELIEFRESNGKFGRHNFCRICQDIYNQEKYLQNKEKKKEQAKKWNGQNPDLVRKYKFNWRLKHNKRKPINEEKIPDF